MSKNRNKTYVLFRAALSKGVIERGTVCENCGRTDTDARIMAHHEDYSQPLVVTWLCGSCHQLLHYMKDPSTRGRISKALRKIFALSPKERDEYYRRRRLEA